MSQDIWWLQRFSNYSRAFILLESAVELSKARPLTKLEKQGLIQCFEYAYELAWKTLKDFMQDKGTIELFGSKDVLREAFKLRLLTEGEIWMEMIKSRNLTSHLYDEKLADEIAQQIAEVYFVRFRHLKDKLSTLQPMQENK